MCILSPMIGRRLSIDSTRKTEREMEQTELYGCCCLSISKFSRDETSQKSEFPAARFSFPARIVCMAGDYVPGAAAAAVVVIYRGAGEARV